MTTLRSRLIGSMFYPPASRIVAALPAGSELILVPQPDNPFDPDAIAVYVRPDQIDLTVIDREGLADFGWTVEKLQRAKEFALGHCASVNHRKRIRESPDTVSALEIKALLTKGPCRATFGTDEEARPIVIVELIEHSKRE